jgi:hypothetical protein
MSMQDVDRQVQERFGDWAQRYPVKVLAQIAGAEQRTAKGWRNGQFPRSPHFSRMVAHWGRQFLDHVYGHLLHDDPTPEQRLDRIEQDLVALRRSIHRARVGVTRVLLILPVLLGAAVDQDAPMLRVRSPRAPVLRVSRQAFHSAGGQV